MAVPSRLSTKVTPEGSAPVSLRAAVGKPVVVTVNVPSVPVVNVVLSALVIAGAWSTVSVKLWVASGSTPLAAVMVSAKCRQFPAPGVPARVAVPSPLSRKVTPPGRRPVSLRAAVGKPVAVTVKVPKVPVANVVLSALVIAGAWSTVRVKFWVASGRTPLAAVMVRA